MTRIYDNDLTSFQYKEVWLKERIPDYWNLSLKLMPGCQFTDTSGQFSMFTDSAPDRNGFFISSNLIKSISSY